MISEMMAVHDVKARAYLPPFVAARVEIGIRACVDAVRQEGHPFKLNPQDYILYHIGKWDDDSGKAVMFQEPLFIGFVGNLGKVGLTKDEEILKSHFGLTREVRS